MLKQWDFTQGKKEVKKVDKNETYNNNDAIEDSKNKNDNDNNEAMIIIVMKYE